MKFESLRQKLQSRPFFETLEAEALFGKGECEALPRISRWVRQGKLIQLRRGKYLLPPRFQIKPTDPFYVSNYLFRPSYVSLFSALQYYRLIPEAVFEIQAVTTRQTATWDTVLGQFRYFSTKTDRFFGYSMVTMGDGEQQTVLIAKPERALIDICYFYSGEWTSDRWRELRLQNREKIECERLLQFAHKMKSRKVERSIQNLLKVIENKDSI